jgi:hypothetical protein
MFGLVDRYFLDLPCPSSTDTGLPVTSLPHATAAIQHMGGWKPVQKALRAVDKVAKKHGVEMQSVVLRWCIDNGVTPVVPAGWKHNAEAFGKRGVDAAALPDAAVFLRPSFLDAADMATLNAAAV